MTHETKEMVWVVGLTIFVAFCVMLAVNFAYGDVKYIGKYFAITFPGDPIIKSDTVGSPYGDVLLTQAEYDIPDFWLHARHALIPHQMFVEQTHKDIAIRMLEPLSNASKRAVAHMIIRSIGVTSKGSGFLVDFEVQGFRYFAVIVVDQPHAWMLAIMDYEDQHRQEALTFLQSFKAFRPEAKP